MYIPLAEKMRPEKIEDVFGQKHILGEGKILSNLIKSKIALNMIFYGPPGTGKTTVARIVANNSNMAFKSLNCTTIGSGEIKDAIMNSGDIFSPNGILLYLDEIQYLNRKQQQVLLESMENGNIKIIASTTENPYFSIYSAVLSRCIVFEFKTLSTNDIKLALKKGIDESFKYYEEKIKISDNNLEILSKVSGGDLRKAINILDACIMGSTVSGGIKEVKKDIILSLSSKSNLSYDKNGDSHYDLLSAFQKSMRGSDPDAAIYYLAMLLEAGDLTSIERRLMVCACEDVGLAYPQIIPIVKASVDIANQVGMPEARIPLADAVILVCLAPKSNSAYKAINQAQSDIKSGEIYNVPNHLKNIDFSDFKDGKKYVYPHDFPNNWIKQPYMPEKFNKQYYFAGENKIEQNFNLYWRKIKKEDEKI